MRILSVVSALLIAGFAAAAPAISDARNAISVPGDNSAQNIIDVVSTATNKLEPLKEQLATAMQSSDASEVDLVVSQMNKIVSDTAEQLQSVTEGVSVNQYNLAELGSSLFNFVSLVNSMLLQFIPISSPKTVFWNTATSNTLNPINTVNPINRLITSVGNLMTILKSFAVGSLANILKPALDMDHTILTKMASLPGLRF